MRKVLVLVILLVGGLVERAEAEFDLLNYKYLWNTNEEKAKMIINPASKKKEADVWKPTREFTDAQCAKLIHILTKQFGEPARCRVGYATFVYVWRFEGGEWLSVGVYTQGNMGGDVCGIFHWEWRKPELSVCTESELNMRKYPIVQIDKEGLPPAAFFEFFDPYASFLETETDRNFITEFNATKYLEKSNRGGTRCTAEWNADEQRYFIYTQRPERGEYSAVKGDVNGGHTNEYCVGNVQFFKVCPNLYMCRSVFFLEGSMGAQQEDYLFGVYERDIWSVDSEKPIRSKLVRYLGVVPLSKIQKVSEDWVGGSSGQPIL